MTNPTDALVIDAAGEQVVVRSAIASRQVRHDLVHKLAADEFLVPLHSTYWRALRAMKDAGLDYTHATMRRFVQQEGGNPDDVYLGELERDAAVASNLEWHVEGMRWDATRARALKGPIPELVLAIGEAKATPDRVMGAARAVVKALDAAGGRRHMHRQGELFRAYEAELDARRVARNFFTSGWSEVDTKLTEGFMPQRTTVVSGLSGSAKSSFVACGLIPNLVRAGRRPLMCVWEMGAYSTLDIMLASLSNISVVRIVQGDYDDDERKVLRRWNAWIQKHVRFMENAFFERVEAAKGRRSNERNLDILTGYLAESGCDVAVYDLWERMLADLSYEGVTRALYQQQDIHREYNMHGIIVQQLGEKGMERNVARRGDMRPSRAAIKGSGAYVEVADKVYGVHRDKLFKDVPDTSLELINLKQRKGPTNWAFRFNWDPTTVRLWDPIEIPFNPGLDAAPEFGGLDDIKTTPGGGKKNERPRMPRRDS